MRVAIIGQKWLAAELLKRCLAEGHQVVIAISPALGADGEYDRLYAAAQQLGVPADWAQGNLNADQVPACDVILAAHAHVYIKEDVRAKATHGALGYHPSLLPRHRGRDAVHWAVHMREPVTGGSVYWLDDGADTGPVLAQDWCHVRPDDTPQVLWRRELAPMGLRLFSQALSMLDAGVYCKGHPQDPALATWEPGVSNRRLSR
ncbi:formyltransferase family protein [Pseudomonas sp. BGI-2]|uniref:formyltransferase family protein n=1 Tax=Pseudomonas sp. BGI-2 TaxID=2528211 RepID=UPI001033CBB0|nr:formyltransferase family protein [Pseudomonas sp. BGI-2]TBN35532.1 methionyl-tRNA formyltransferase [Pseudomonas sp. BGI-2]